jgi:hypothetical protein
MFRNPDPEAICALLREVKTIAVVGPCAEVADAG